MTVIDVKLLDARMAESLVEKMEVIGAALDETDL